MGPDQPAQPPGDAPPASGTEAFSGFLKLALDHSAPAAAGPATAVSRTVLAAKAKALPDEKKQSDRLALATPDSPPSTKEVLPFALGLNFRPPNPKQKDDLGNGADKADAGSEKTSALAQPTSQTLTEISPNGRGISLSSATLQPSLAFSAMIRDRVAPAVNIDARPAPAKPVTAEDNTLSTARDSSSKKKSEAQSLTAAEQATPSASNGSETAAAQTSGGQQHEAHSGGEAAPTRQISALAAAQPVDTIKDPAPATGMVRDISIQLPGATKGAPPVEVHVSMQTGEVRVDVRSFNPAVNQDLRTHLNDLVGRLDRQGLQAEISHSGTVAATTESAGAGLDRQSSEDSPGDHPQQQQRHPNQQNQGQREPGEGGQQHSRNRAAQWANIMQTNSWNF